MYIDHHEYGLIDLSDINRAKKQFDISAARKFCIMVASKTNPPYILEFDTSAEQEKVYDVISNELKARKVGVL